ncbi:MAG: DNA polymerase III subunit gamma/tau [Firmicutes bacterium]|nr:DNA polymerase III subunit gamma/tau [Bacillota bacterium]
MYQALYRKYRPLTFDEVVGQDVIIRTLKNAVLNKKISHAYLFTGPRGTGKTTIAKILAKTINCLNLNDMTPCNNCVSCTQINQKQSTDIVEIDAASNNGVDEIREIRNKVNLVPSISKYKVYIIDEVHMLTTGAFNALLKTLEEPPSHIIFILATTEPHKIPATILSRCQRFDFKRISSNKLVERLEFISKQEKIDIDKQALFEISRISEGGMRDAISMLDQVLSYSEGMVTLEDVHEVNGTLSQKDLGEFIENIFDKNILEVLKLIDKYNDLGKNIIKLSEEIIQLLKNILLYKTVPNYFDDKELEALYERLGNNTKVEHLINLIDEFNNSLPKLKQSNDPKLILELLVIKYISTNNEIKVQNSEQIIEKKQEVSSKIEQIDKIKKEKVKKETSLEQKEEKKIQENKTLEKTDEFHKKIDELKNIRINNTLAEFNKQHFLFIKEELDNIKDMLLNPDYSEFVSTILDGTLKAASDKNLIFVYNTDTLSNYFNENLLIIEEILENNYNKHYDAIAVDNISWEIIKKEFNSKSKLYVYQKETIDIKDLFSSPKESDELNDLFGEIIEIVN